MDSLIRMEIKVDVKPNRSITADRISHLRLPIVGWAIPDQTKEIRIRLKIALVDVKSGQWEIFEPKVFEDTAYTASLNREQSNLEQVAQLKRKVYQAAVESIIARYMK